MCMCMCMCTCVCVCNPRACNSHNRSINREIRPAFEPNCTLHICALGCRCVLLVCYVSRTRVSRVMHTCHTPVSRITHRAHTCTCVLHVSQGACILRFSRHQQLAGGDGLCGCRGDHLMTHARVSMRVLHVHACICMSHTYITRHTHTSHVAHTHHTSHPRLTRHAGQDAFRQVAQQQPAHWQRPQLLPNPQDQARAAT